MPTKKIEKITAWSYSRLSTYSECPQKARYRYIDKLKEPSSAPLERGSAIHKLAEDYAKGRLKRLPTELKLFKDEFKKLKKQVLSLEGQWAFDKNWNPCGWFDKAAYCRAMLDVVYEEGNMLYIKDHKTGKVRENMEQLELYALTGLLMYPHIDEVSAEFWFLDHGVILPQMCTTYKRSQLPVLKKKWEKKVTPMLSDTRFAPKPSNTCRWCHFRAGNGGPCKF